MDVENLETLEEKARFYSLLAKHERLHAQGKHLPYEQHRELHDLVKQQGGDLTFPGRIPMNDLEHAGVDRLLARHGKTATLTRRDPGNTGPVLVHIAGAGTFEVATNGKTKKVA